METENRKKTPDAIDIDENKDHMQTLSEAESTSSIPDSKGNERLLADILSEQDMKNIRNMLEKDAWRS